MERLLNVVGLIDVPGREVVGNGLICGSLPVGFMLEPRRLPDPFLTSHAILPGLSFAWSDFIETLDLWSEFGPLRYILT